MAKLMFVSGVLAVIIYSIEPYNLTRFWHLMFPPKNLYEPVFKEDIVQIYSYEGEYQISCNRSEVYEIGIVTNQKSLISNFNQSNDDIFRFNEEIEIIIFSGNSVLLKAVLDKPIVKRHFRNDMGYYKEIVLTTLGVSKCNNLRLKINFLSSELVHEGKGQYYFYIAVSKIP